MENQFNDSYYPTIESTHHKNIVHDGTTYECEIIDTAGQVSRSRQVRVSEGQIRGADTRPLSYPELHRKRHPTDELSGYTRTNTRSSTTSTP